MRLDREADVASIKARVKMELDLPEHEQLIMFKGRLIKNDKSRPLDDEELDDFIHERGEDGVDMAVVYRKKHLPEFLEREGLETVNDLKPTGATALHRAVRVCDLFVTEELLENEEFTKVDACDRSGQTALHTAASCRFREMCQALLGSPRFSRVGAKDADGQNILHRAACWGDLVVCKLVLEHKLFTARHGNARDGLGHTPMEYATDMGHEDVAAAIVAAYGHGQSQGQILDPDSGEDMHHDEFAPTPKEQVPAPEPQPESAVADNAEGMVVGAANTLLSGVAPAFPDKELAPEASAVS